MSQGRRGRVEDVQEEDRRCRFRNWRWLCRKPAADVAGTLGSMGWGVQGAYLLSVETSQALCHPLLLSCDIPIRTLWGVTIQASSVKLHHLPNVTKWQKGNLSPGVFCPQSPFLMVPHLGHRLFPGSGRSANHGHKGSQIWMPTHLRVGVGRGSSTCAAGLAPSCLTVSKWPLLGVDWQSPRCPGSLPWCNCEAGSVFHSLSSGALIE